MTDSVNISPGHVGRPRENARTFNRAPHSDGWIVPNTDTLLADVRSELSAGPYNAFAESHSSSSYDVTIDTGEAVVGGVSLARDVTTTVTIDANVSAQAVYLGWSESSQDTIVIGKDAAFASSNPRIKIWEFDSDGSGVTASTDYRNVGEQISVQNARYEGSGTKVDAAEDADTLTGVAPSSFLRSDQDDSTSGAFGLFANGSATGSLGNSAGEYSRVSGSASDFTQNVSDGFGRVLFAWNAYYDSANSTWKSIVSGEPHAAIGFLATPGNGTSTGNLSFATAPSNANAGDTITWNVAVVQENGNVDFQQSELKNAIIEQRSSRPNSPSVGQIIYRTDKD